jgi:hypothetical protein
MMPKRFWHCIIVFFIAALKKHLVTLKMNITPQDIHAYFE